MFDPIPGLVIRYDFLWKEEELLGLEQGRKDRPCAVVVVAQSKKEKIRNIVLCPITHSPPRSEEIAVEIPYKLARYLKLDDDRSWIKTHQVNTVEWHNDYLPFGVVPAYKGEWVFGKLHHSLGKQVFEQVRANFNNKKLENVHRDQG